MEIIPAILYTQWLRYHQDGTVAPELQYHLDGTVEIELQYRPMYIYA